MKKLIEIILMVGTSGSGKSTFVKEWLKKHSDYIRINRDDIRKTLMHNLDGYYQREDLNQIEGIVSTVESTIAWRSLAKGYSLIIDNTNLTKDYIEKWLKIVEDSKTTFPYNQVEFRFKIVELEPTLCKQRVIFRDNFMENQPEFMYDKMLERVAYIDKQAAQFKNIKEYITSTYKDKIIQ